MTMKVKGVMAVATFVALAGAAIASAQSAPRLTAPTLQSTATAQDPPASQNPPSSERGREATVGGELTRVTPDTKMFTVKNASGEIQFKYSDKTVITGAQKTVAGLATMSGEQVMVTYRVDGGTNLATKIEVRERK